MNANLYLEKCTWLRRVLVVLLAPMVVILIGIGEGLRAWLDFVADCW